MLVRLRCEGRQKRETSQCLQIPSDDEDELLAPQVKLPQQTKQQRQQQHRQEWQPVSCSSPLTYSPTNPSLDHLAGASVLLSTTQLHLTPWLSLCTWCALSGCLLRLETALSCLCVWLFLLQKPANLAGKHPLPSGITPSPRLHCTQLLCRRHRGRHCWGCGCRSLLG